MKAKCIKEYENVKKGEILEIKENKIEYRNIYGEKGLYKNNKLICALNSSVKETCFKIIDDEKVNHPSHYQGEMETIDIIEYVLSDINSKHTFALGNIIKYCNRANRKGKIEDLDKAKWYAERLLNG